MFAKLLLVLLTAAATAASLLVVRQQRLELAHRAAVLHEQCQSHHEALWVLESEIARRCRPERVRHAITRLQAQWVPIPARPAPSPAEALRIAGGLPPALAVRRTELEPPRLVLAAGVTDDSG